MTYEGLECSHLQSWVLLSWSRIFSSVPLSRCSLKVWSFFSGIPLYSDIMNSWLHWPPRFISKCFRLQDSLPITVSNIPDLPLAWGFCWSNYQYITGHLNICSLRAYKSFMSQNILSYCDSLGDILAGEFVTGVLSDALLFHLSFLGLGTSLLCLLKAGSTSHWIELKISAVCFLSPPPLQASVAPWPCPYLHLPQTLTQKPMLPSEDEDGKCTLAAMVAVARSGSWPAEAQVLAGAPVPAGLVRAALSLPMRMAASGLSQFCLRF